MHELVILDAGVPLPCLRGPISCLTGYIKTGSRGVTRAEGGGGVQAWETLHARE